MVIKTFYDFSVFSVPLWWTKFSDHYSAEQAQPLHAAGFGASVFGQYPVLNQPSPFRVKAVDEIIFSTAAPQWGHWLAGGSENF